VLLKENPEGRTDRPGYEPDVFDNMCKLLREHRDSAYEIGWLEEASEYHEVLAAACAFYESAARGGEFVPGDAWDPTRGDWTKETTRNMQTGEDIPTDAIAILIPQPHRKTEHMPSRIAQQRAKNPLVYLAEDSKHFLLFRAMRESDKFSPVDWSTARTEPCFRKSTHDSTPLSAADLAGYLQAAHAELYPTEAAACTYALHGARIGRIQSLKAAGGTSAQLRLMNLPGGPPTATTLPRQSGFVAASASDEDTMNKISGHTQSAGRTGYDSSMLADEIALRLAANSVDVLPMDTVHRFVRDGSGDNDAVAVVRNRDNQLQVVKTRMSPLPAQQRVFTAGARSTASRAKAAPRPILQSSQAKAVARKFSTTTIAASVSAASDSGRVTSNDSTNTSPASALGNLVATASSARVSVVDPALPASPVRTTLPEMPTLPDPACRLSVDGSRQSRLRATLAPRLKSGAILRPCEDCRSKSADYGVAADGFHRRWCGGCARLHGATRKGAAVKDLPVAPDTY
jgi:hypothetical protein